jgi:hypothetical protein
MVVVWIICARELSRLSKTCSTPYQGANLRIPQATRHTGLIVQRSLSWPKTAPMR